MGSWWLKEQLLSAELKLGGREMMLCSAINVENGYWRTMCSVPLAEALLASGWLKPSAGIGDDFFPSLPLWFS